MTALQTLIGDALSSTVVTLVPLSGGCVSQVVRAELEDGRSVVAKVEPGAGERRDDKAVKKVGDHADDGPGIEVPSALECEANMLDTLRAAGWPVPMVLHCRPTLLLMECVDHDMGEEVRAVSSLSGGESFLASLALASDDCPDFCVCKWKSGKETTECVQQDLAEVPYGIAPGTQVLDLRGNPIEGLKDAVEGNGKAVIVNKTRSVEIAVTARSARDRRRRSSSSRGCPGRACRRRGSSRRRRVRSRA